MSAQFVVQSFKAGKRGALKPDTPFEARSVNHARTVAERMAATRPLVVAFMRESDPATGEYDDAKLIAAIGASIPDEINEMPRA